MIAHNRMKSVRRTGTKAELLLQQALDSMGFKYKVNASVIPNSTRKADIIFLKEKIVVFVDGCFWHGCPLHGTKAKANAEFWYLKIKANKRRDKDTNRKLEKEGWLVIRVWEHEDPKEAAAKIADLVREKRKQIKANKRG